MIPAPAKSSFDPALEVQRLGRRAVRACDLAARGGQWTPATLRAAAQGLEEGDRAFGVTRRWPRLAASLKRIGALWAAKTMRVSS